MSGTELVKRKGGIQPNRFGENPVVSDDMRLEFHRTSLSNFSLSGDFVPQPLNKSRIQCEFTKA